jgi:Spy/CpxP family protein refolding chaperone
MASTLCRRALVALLVAALFAPWFSLAVQAQQDRPAAREAEDKDAAPRAKSRGRLPTFYSRLVTAEQREQIYEIQGRYAEQIDELMSELRAVEAQRDQEIHDVLTPAQQKKIAELMEDAKKRREALRGSEDGDEEPAATDVEEEEGR